MHTLTFWVWFWSFLASAVLPWLNAELLMLALLPLAVAKGQVASLALAAIAGQMAGKTILYWVARGGADRVLGARANEAMERWRPSIVNPSRAVPLLLVSSGVGFPPLFALTIVAGSLQMPFPVFLLASTAGRIVHFGAIALLPHLFG